MILSQVSALSRPQLRPQLGNMLLNVSQADKDAEGLTSGVPLTHHLAHDRLKLLTLNTSHKCFHSESTGWGAGMWSESAWAPACCVANGEVLSPLWATFPVYKIRQLHLIISRSSESSGNDPLSPNS